ncbi:MAG: lytic transglycosylase domain-containing protein [Chthonomonas sp.]|nr:lytic transglycosylase domain-containing protein [Chthonomonas sp.]
MAEIQARMAQISGARTYPRKIFEPPKSDFGAVMEGKIGDQEGGLLPMAPGMFAPEPGGEIRSLIVEAANAEGVEPALLEALVSVESNFNPGAVSKSGAQGLTQLMPGTARALGVQDPFDPVQNLRGGAKYLRQMLGKYGDLSKALAAYNAGPGSVDRYQGIPPFRETQNYVRRVQERYGLIARGGIQ